MKVYLVTCKWLVDGTSDILLVTGSKERAEKEKNEFEEHLGVDISYQVCEMEVQDMPHGV